MKYESCTLKTTQVIVSVPKCWQSSVVTLNIDLLTPKCIGIFLSSSCIYVWNMEAVRWILLKLSCQNQSYCVRTKVFTKFRCDLDLWPFDPKMYRYLPLTIFHLCMKLWLWKLYVENYPSYCVRTKVLTKFRCDLDLWTADPKMYRYLPLTILHLCMKYESCTLKTTQVIVSEPKCWQSSVVTLTFGPKNV